MKFLIALLLTATLSVSADDWKLERDRSGIKVYTRRVEGIAFKQYKGIVTLKAPLPTVIAVIEDVDAAPEWVDSCERMELVERVSPTESYTYNYVPAPWPVKDRDAVVHNRITQDEKTYVVTIKQTAKPDKKARIKKAVRVERIEGLWILTPQKDGTTELVYQVLSDPGGGLPAWLVNAVAISQPFNTLENLQEMVLREKYQSATFDFIKMPES
jgi:hypothetical protein